MAPVVSPMWSRSQVSIQWCCASLTFQTVFCSQTMLKMPRDSPHQPCFSLPSPCTPGVLVPPQSQALPQELILG